MNDIKILNNMQKKTDLKYIQIRWRYGLPRKGIHFLEHLAYGVQYDLLVGRSTQSPGTTVFNDTFAHPPWNICYEIFD